MTVCCESRIQQSHCEYSFPFTRPRVCVLLHVSSRIKCIHLSINSIFLSIGSTGARIYRDKRHVSLSMSSRQNPSKSKKSSNSTGAKGVSSNRDQKNGNVPNGDRDPNKLNSRTASKFLLSSQASNHRHTVHSFICFTNTILFPQTIPACLKYNL